MKLLLTGAFKYSEEQLDRLKSIGYEILFIQDERDPLEVDVSDIDAVVCNGLFLYNDIKKFEKLKFIQLTSSGLDRVPLDYIKEHGIRFSSAKGVYSIPMAEWVVLKVLEIYKKSRQFYEAQHDHKWEKQRDLLELSGKTASIVGFGDVGSEIAKRLKAFNVYVIGIGRREFKSPLINEYYLIDYIDEALIKSDIVILTLPLTKDTLHFIDSKIFENMKDRSVLINVSRGDIINETDLIKSLNTGKFMGVALDVFHHEPLPIKNPLWSHPRVIATPHNSFVSDNVAGRLYNLIYEKLKYFIES